jgi:Ni/Fe-hydrogenase 1 B-type cytochrome subunit
MMSTTTGHKIIPTYVWEVPVRIWHWVMALCMVVLGITGYLIGTPPGSVGGEASEHFLFGYIRFAHFAAAYVFAIVFVWRVI